MSEEKPRPVSPINGVPLPPGRANWKAGEEARELGRKGGKKSVEVRRQRKTLKEDLLRLLREEVPGKNGQSRPAQEAITTALLKQAMSGNIKAFEVIRDTIGEKQAETVTIISPDYSALNEAFDSLRKPLEGGQT